MKQARLLNNIIGGSYETDERMAGCAVSQNLYAESVEEASNGFYYTTSLRSVEGERVIIKDFTQGKSPKGCRGMFTASDGSVFAAFGDGIYRITKDRYTGKYEAVLIYGGRFSGVVNFCETGGINSHVCWVNGTEYVMAYPLSPEKAEALGMTPPFIFHTPLRQYKTADQILNDREEHVAPSQICSLNGSLIINDPESDTWYYTDAYILGGTTYDREIYELKDGQVQYVGEGSYQVKTKTVKLTDNDPTSGTSYLWLDRYSKPNFMTAEYSADKVTGICVSGDFFFVFGSRSIQIYSQATSTDAQGFSSMVFNSSGRNIRDIGSNCEESIVTMNGNVFFLGANVQGGCSVWFISGGSPNRISTNAIERELDGVDVRNTYGCCYYKNGHQFYILTIPSIDKTYVYDLATRQWHNRSTYKNGKNSAWWVRFIACTNGDVIICGKGEDVVARMDKDKYDDYRGEPIIKMRTAPVIVSDYSPFIVNDIQLLWNTGTTRDVTNENGAKNPAVMLEVSTDGGNTFGGERWAYGGNTGNYGHRTVWYGIGGVGTLFVFRFTISDRVNVVITGAKISHTKLGAF